MRFRKLAVTTLIIGMTAGALAPLAAHGESEKKERFFESQYRHDVMEHFNYSMKKLVPILFKGAGHEDHLPAIAKIMSNAAIMSKTAFEKDTRGMEGHTESKDKIWDNWDDFAKRLDKLEADTAAFVVATETADNALIIPAFKQVGSNCKSCHDEYKNK